MSQEVIEHAKDVYDYLIKHPERHRQSDWVMTGGVVGTIAGDISLCNTTMCAAGTSVFLKQGPAALIEAYQEDGVGELAQSNLGLTTLEAEDLFFNMNEEDVLERLREIAYPDFGVLE